MVNLRGPLERDVVHGDDLVAARQPAALIGRAALHDLRHVDASAAS